MKIQRKKIIKLMDIHNDANTKILQQTLNDKQCQIGIIDVDGKIKQAYGECKESMDMSYKGK